jgi:hypothetical protein
MSLGTGMPYCWLCKQFLHEQKYCNLHKIYIPLEKGYVICKDFSDVKYDDYTKKNEWFIKFRKLKLINHDALYIYAENSSYEEYIPFADLKHKDAGSG